MQLGQTLTDDQETAFDFILPAVEEWIDAETGSAWLTGAVASETHHGPFGGPLVFLRQRPVTAVASVTAVNEWNADPTTLVDATDYSLYDAARGVLYLAGYVGWRQLTVAYTPAPSLPWTINRLATLLAAGTLPSAAGGGTVDPSIVKSYEVGGDFSVTFRDAIAGVFQSSEVQRLVSMHRQRQFA
jgi:hypothetical protein